MSVIARLVATTLLVISLTGLSTFGLVIYDQYHPQLLASLDGDRNHELVRYTVEARSQTLLKAKGRTDILVVFLHGRGANDQSYLTANFVKELKRDEHKSVSVLFPDSSDHSYWHNREAYDWSDYLNVLAVNRALARLNIGDTPKIIIAGISMGGYGALLNAELQPQEYCGVVVHSPALWPDYSGAAAGAFDDSSDFEAGNVFSKAEKLKGKYISIDIGSADSLQSGTKHFGDRLVSSGVPAYLRTFDGGHSMKYWNAHWADYFSYYHAAAGSCK